MKSARFSLSSEKEERRKFRSKTPLSGSLPTRPSRGEKVHRLGNTVSDRKSNSFAETKIFYGNSCVIAMMRVDEGMDFCRKKVVHSGTSVLSGCVAFWLALFAGLSTSGAVAAVADVAEANKLFNAGKYSDCITLAETAIAARHDGNRAIEVHRFSPVSAAMLECSLQSPQRIRQAL